MSMNSNHVAGIKPLHPSGTNSTMFTTCCNVAICNDQTHCPACIRKVDGWDIESAHERGVYRWKKYYQGEKNGR